MKKEILVNLKLKRILVVKQVKLYEVDKLEVKENYIMYILDKKIGNTYN